MNTKAAFAAFALAAGAAILAVPTASAQPGVSQHVIEMANGKVDFSNWGNTFHNPARLGVLADCADPAKASPVRIGKDIQFTLKPHEDGGLLGSVLLTKVKAGKYPITFSCGDVHYKADIFVVAEQRPTTSKPKPKPTTSTAAVPTKPKGAPETGGGGTEENGALGYAIGGTALLGGIGAGAFALRRRRQVQN
ncbi:hypothetical protein JOF53_004579 [Crossiella equi]|uniref:Gram-positive cocci surface proteins LPxTG domain-containing protein n=1 Tax=Crossiella equi TaxID=130796 RepID=A0ABS5AH76_9PSEU|nr:hypothetical protein [Crossiella equi]MBP2475707.1 hypothetical protein [Crossiella equi]